MFHAELVSHSSILPKFHTFAEQINGENSAKIVQSNTRPRGELAYILAYYKAFQDPKSDTSDVKALLGLAHFSMMVMCPSHDMTEIITTPHGLKCLSAPDGRRGVSAVLFSGDGEQWASALKHAGMGSESLQQWGMACHKQFAMNNLEDLFGRMKPQGGTQYLLEYK